MCVYVTGVNICVFVSGRRQGWLWDTAHSWLNYSWPQNKKAAPSIYRPQDDCKSHSPGSEPERFLPTLPHLLRWWPEPCCLPLSPAGLLHGYSRPWEATEHQEFQVVLKGPRWRLGPRWSTGLFADPPLSCLPAPGTSPGKESHLEPAMEGGRAWASPLYILWLSQGMQIPSPSHTGLAEQVEHFSLSVSEKEPDIQLW